MDEDEVREHIWQEGSAGFLSVMMPRSIPPGPRLDMREKTVMELALLLNALSEVESYSAADELVRRAAAERVTVGWLVYDGARKDPSAPVTP
jgi:hypothetical protein